MKRTLIALLLAAPAIAGAQPFSYDYVGAGYTNTKEDHDLEADTWAGGISYSPVEHFYLRADGAASQVDSTPMDTRTFSLALGGYTSLASNADLYGGLIGVWSQVQDIPQQDDSKGYGAGAEIGLRAWLFPGVEVDLNGTYVDLFHGDFNDAGVDTDDFNAGVGLRVYPVERISIGGSYSHAFDAETDSLGVDLRYDF